MYTSIASKYNKNLPALIILVLVFVWPFVFLFCQCFFTKKMGEIIYVFFFSLYGYSLVASSTILIVIPFIYINKLLKIQLISKELFYVL